MESCRASDCRPPGASRQWKGTSEIRKRTERAGILVFNRSAKLTPKILDAQNRLTLLEILEDRHGRRSPVFVSQLPISSWHEVIGDPAIADANCDHVIHNVHRIELKGDSVTKIYTNN
ncbi:MAG: ATP-binding protein [Deltaproteobacteria bacterium]|nr:ATP-binding protein [Deltaproteobacteria bacterium]